MTISTAAASADSRRLPDERFLYAIWLLLPAAVLGAASRRNLSTLSKPLSLFATALLLLSLLACAGVSAGGGGGGNQNPVSYQITGTGTSQGTAGDPGQSTVVTLVID